MECNNKARCYTEQYLREIGDWPLMEITSSTDMIPLPFLNKGVTVVYSLKDGKKVINNVLHRRVYVGYGEFCYISYANIHAP